MCLGLAELLALSSLARTYIVAPSALIAANSPMSRSFITCMKRDTTAMTIAMEVRCIFHNWSLPTLYWLLQ